MLNKNKIIWFIFNNTYDIFDLYHFMKKTLHVQKGFIFLDVDGFGEFLFSICKYSSYLEKEGFYGCNCVTNM